VLQLIFRLLLALVAFRLIGGFLGRLRKPKRSKPRGPKVTSRDPNREVDPYRDLTPYEIEDAEYEDLPRNKD
jgi:hypothetical protein